MAIMFGFIIGLLTIAAAMVHCTVIMSREFELEGRIVGGSDAAMENFPYQVSVRAYGTHCCGGSILNKQTIITAAHCVHSYVSTSCYSIQYGISVIGGYKNIITAKRVLRNEHFNYSNFSNDVALIFLVSDIPFSEVAQPIQMASTAPAVGLFANITGWGALAENRENARTLQQVSVQIMDKTVCEEQYRGINKITETMICAGVIGGGKDACQDDSGGPLVINGSLGGIVYYGMGCARANFYGVYSNIAALRYWIDYNLIE